MLNEREQIQTPYCNPKDENNIRSAFINSTENYPNLEVWFLSIQAAIQHTKLRNQVKVNNDWNTTGFWLQDFQMDSKTSRSSFQTAKSSELPDYLELRRTIMRGEFCLDYVDKFSLYQNEETFPMRREERGGGAGFLATADRTQGRKR